MTTDHTPSRSCYQRGCRTVACATENYRYMSRLRLEHSRGQRRRTDATQTRHHIERLIAHGWTQAQIARTAGLVHHLISDVRYGKETISTKTAYAVLSVPLGPPPADTRDVDATGTIRRLRALVAIGWPIDQLAPQVGIFPTALGNIARGELAHVRATTADTVALHYQHLVRRPGPSNRSRILARKKGWHGPAAWDDIDNPDEQPDLDPPADELDLKRNDLAAHRRAEIEHLDSFGLPVLDIAARLDIAESTVNGVLREIRAGQRRDRRPDTEKAAA